MTIFLKNHEHSVEDSVLKHFHDNGSHGDSSIAVTRERVFAFALVAIDRWYNTCQEAGWDVFKCAKAQAICFNHARCEEEATKLEVLRLEAINATSFATFELL